MGHVLGTPVPGVGGAVLRYGERVKEMSGGEVNTTYQRMELLAAVEALEFLTEPCEVSLYTNSAYMLNCFAQKWYVGWESSGWVNSKKEPVANPDLWQRLLVQYRRHKVEWVKVKGHAGVEDNERADQLARDAVPKAVTFQLEGGI